MGRWIRTSVRVVLTTDQKGNVAEQAVALAAIRLGLQVYRPLGEGGRYDLIIDAGHRLWRVQCKWSSRREDVVPVRCRSSRRAREGLRARGYTAEEIDAYAAYCPELDKCYLIPIDQFPGQGGIHLRLGPAKNSQRGAIIWARDFDFAAIDWTVFGAVAQMARASAWHAEGRGFESPQLHSETEPSAPSSVGAHTFRNHFGYFLERVVRGEELLVTRRGRPYVRLMPP